MPVRPNFFIIGAPKAGSTSLWHELRRHPDIFMPNLKEPNFFCTDEAGSDDGSWYYGLFEEGRGKKAVGEASVAYSLVERNPETPARIARCVPEARLIYIVRHPLRRIESAWLHHLHRRNPVPRSFSEAVRRFRPLTEGTLYARNLGCYRRHFPDEQILVVFAENLKAHPRRVLEECDRFLGVDPSARPQRFRALRNVSAGKYRMPLILHEMRDAVPGGATLERMIPRALKRVVRPLIGTPLPDRPEWDPATRRQALDQVGDDAKAILAYAGKPSDFWDLTVS